jgi:hypothetical protein
MVDCWHLALSLPGGTLGASAVALPTDPLAGVPLLSMPMFVQAASTVLLVAITAWYAFQTWRSTSLAQQQMAVEARRRHAQTVQKRTGAWREDFPEVRPTQVHLPDSTGDADHEAALYPAELDNDPYFDDLLENHAEDVAALTAEVADELAAYRRKRAEFVENTDLKLDGQLWSLVEPNFYEWLFERIVLVERGVMDETELKADLRDAFADPRVEGSATVYPGDTDPDRRRDILVFHRTRSTARNRDGESPHRLSANRIINVIDGLDRLGEYATAVEASEVLNDLDADLAELERRVVEYDELDLMPGDCEYVAST